MIGPVARLAADRVGVAVPEEAAERTGSDELEAVRAFLVIPSAHEFGHARIGWTVVDADRMGGLAIEEIIGATRIGFELVDPARQQPVDQVPVADASLATAEQIVV